MIEIDPQTLVRWGTSHSIYWFTQVWSVCPSCMHLVKAETSEVGAPLETREDDPWGLHPLVGLDLCPHMKSCLEAYFWEVRGYGRHRTLHMTFEEIVGQPISDEMEALAKQIVAQPKVDFAKMSTAEKERAIAIATAFIMGDDNDPKTEAWVSCAACYECLNDPSMGLMNPVNRRMVVCTVCGNKRCPKAAHHLNACTNSNEEGQPGSNYPKLDF